MDTKVINGLYSPQFVKPFILCFKMLNDCNINFFDDDLPKYKQYYRFVIIVPCALLYYISLLLGIVNVISETKDVLDLAYTAPIFMIVSQAIFKAATMILKKKDIKKIIEDLAAMWRTDVLTNTQVMKRNAVLAKIDVCQRLFYYSSMLGSAMYTLTPLLETLLRRCILKEDSQLLLPYPCSYPFDPTATYFIYIALYIFESYSMFKCIFAYLGCEFLMVAICSHLVAEFTLLREDILNLKPTKNNIKRQNAEANEEGINVVIKRHQKLVDLSQRLDDIFNRINFVILMFATIITCFFAFTAKVSTGGVFMITNYLAVFGMLAPLFILCYFSELLTNESAGIADSAYENSWYEGGPSYQKSICFIIVRVKDIYRLSFIPTNITLFVGFTWSNPLIKDSKAQKPCCLTSMKYAPINLASFSKVLSTTWSYFSLILRVYEDVQ